MPDLNHSIESYDELCHSCKKMSAIKIIGINRLVCVSCKKAHCYVCKVEVSPNPILGYRHFSPDHGELLGFFPGYCPLYSTCGDFRLRHSRSTEKECRICKEIKSEYPEYELYLGTEKDLFPWLKEKERQQLYICNLCQTSKKFICQFDQHMRNHTKYGQHVVIIALKAEVEREFWSHLDEINFSIVEGELMKTKGLSAVLTVFGIKQLKEEHYSLNEIDLKDMNLGAALLLKPGTGKEIEHELSKMLNKTDLIEKYKVIYTKNYYTETYGHYSPFRKNYKFDKLISFDSFRRDDSLWQRNKALLEDRCSLTYPNNTYKSTLVHSHLIENGIFIVYPKGQVTYKKEVLNYLWKIVKDSYNCCCVSKFFCSTSTNLGGCIEGCCGKCSKADLKTKQSISDSDSQTTEEETSSDAESESTSKSSDSDQESDFMKNWSS